MLHVICGAPCAGKSSHVKEHARTGDLIIDADAIASALGFSNAHGATGPIWEATLKARKAAIDYAINAGCNAWLIDSSPTEHSLKLYDSVNAEVTVIDPGLEECLSRAKKRPKGTEEAIIRWYSNGTSVYLKNWPVSRKTADGSGCDPCDKSVADKGDIMQRSDIVEIFPEATKEQLDALMDLHGAGINGFKADVAKLTGQLEEAQKKLTATPGNDQSEELKKAQEALAAANSELATLKAANELRQIREKVAAEKNIPVNLLNGEDEAACIAQADAILAFAKPGSYPAVKDGGEVSAAGADGKDASWAALSSQIIKK